MKVQEEHYSPKKVELNRLIEYLKNKGARDIELRDNNIAIGCLYRDSLVIAGYINEDVTQKILLICRDKEVFKELEQILLRPKT